MYTPNWKSLDPTSSDLVCWKGLPWVKVGGLEVSFETVGVAPSVGENVGLRVGFNVGNGSVVAPPSVGSNVGDRVGSGSRGSIGAGEGFGVGLLVGFGVVRPPQTLKTWHPATLPNSALQHSLTVSYNFESSSGKLLSLVHELGFTSLVLLCQNGPHSEGASVGFKVGFKVGFYFA